MSLSKILLVLVVLGSCDCKRRWDYELLETYGQSSDESKLRIDLIVQRVGRNDVGYSGTVDWKYDVDNTTMVEVKILKSYSGSESDYQLLPFSLPKKRLRDVKDLFNNMAYPNLEICSNLPQFEDEILNAWPKKLYKFDMCNFDRGNLPEVLSDSNYKIIFEFSGQVNWSVTYVLMVKTKLI